MTRGLFVRLRWTLTAWYAGIFTLLLVGFGLSTYLFLASTLTGAVDEANHAAARLLAGVFEREGAVVRLEPEHFDHEWREVSVSFGIVIADVYDAAGVRVAARRSVPARVSLAGPEHATVTWRGHELRVLRMPVRDPAGQLGHLVVARPMHDLTRDLARVARGMAIAIPLAVLGACAGGLALAGLALRPLRATLEAQRRFMADASHELRTPVTLVQTQAEVALAQRDPVATRSALEGILRAAQALGVLVGDLLFLARSEAPGQAGEHRTFYLDELVAEVVQDHQALAGTRQLVLSEAHEREDLRIEGEPEALRRLVTILVDNALKFTPAGGHVAVRTGVQGGQAWLRVEDDGPGIALAEQGRVFERFYRAAAARTAATPGTGLGLAIAQAIAQAHHGRLVLESTPGTGTRITFTLPA